LLLESKPVQTTEGAKCSHHCVCLGPT
jgi:hypothetical protein